MRNLFLVFALAAACGTDGPTDGPGTITVTVNGVTGGTGKLLITEARAADGRQAAISCVPIAADPFTTSVVLEEIVGPTPCEDSAPIELAAGTYTIQTVVMMGGGPGPEQCASSSVVVVGDVTVTMPALAACP